MTPRVFSRRQVLSMSGASLLLTATGSAVGQTSTYPDRAIKIIVPWSAGGGGDVIVRVVAKSLSQRLGQPVVVDNRPGALGTIGSQVVARSPADGYTLVYATADSHSVAPYLVKTVYDTRKDFTAIAPLGSFPLGLAVQASHPAQSLEQFLKMAKDAKEPLTYGSWGQGSTAHIIMEAFKTATKVDMLHVPYNGAGPLAQAQLSGQVNCSLNGLTPLEPHLRAGTLRLLAITAKERMAQFPEVPIMRELGIEIDMGPWFGLFGPAGIPPHIVTRLHDAIDATLREPQVLEQTKRLLVVTEHMKQPSYQEFFLKEFDRWGKHIQTAGIKLD